MTAADLQERVAGLAAKAKAQAEANRAKAPEFAQFVDEMRATFGDVKVRYVRWPDGSEQGKPFAGVALPLSTPPAPTPPRARRSDPSTSQQAAASAKVFAGEHHQRILAALAQPATCHELAAITGLDHVAVARRMAELRGVGQVCDTGRTRAAANGRPCTVWARAA